MGLPFSTPGCLRIHGGLVLRVGLQPEEPHFRVSGQRMVRRRVCGTEGVPVHLGSGRPGRREGALCVAGICFKHRSQIHSLRQKPSPVPLQHLPDPRPPQTLPFLPLRERDILLQRPQSQAGILFSTFIPGTTRQLCFSFQPDCLQLFPFSQDIISHPAPNVVLQGQPRDANPESQSPLWKYLLF